MEQGKHPKQTKSAYRITFAAQLIGIITVIIIAIIAWSFKKEAPDCGRIHDTELKKEVERERAWRAGDTLIIGPDGSLILKPEGMEAPDFFGVVKADQDSGYITKPGIVKDVDTSRY